MSTDTKERSGTGTRQGDATSWKDAPWVAARGFLMGSADVVPGVSGGTMALITGIYTRLIDAIRSVDAVAIGHLLRFRFGAFFRHVHWRFLASLVAGMFCAVIFFTRVVPLPVLIFTHPEPVYGLFFGLIVGSVVLLLADVRPLDIRRVLFLLVGTFIGWWVVTLVPTDTPEALWFIFLSGALAICAMILPGISGSFILLILGKYSYIFGQFGLLGGGETSGALVVLAVFGMGILTGIAAFSRFLSWLLHRFNAPTMCVLIGFLVGSLVVIWPWQNRQYETIRESVEVTSGDPRTTSAHPEDSSPLLPEYYVVAPPSPNNDLIPLTRVRKKLIHSEPVWPQASSPISGPLAAMGLGLAMVMGIGWLGKKAGR